MTKTCSKCRQEKPLGAFHKGSNYPLGVYPACKVCVLKKCAEYRNRNRAAIRASQKAHRRYDPEYMRKWKYGLTAAEYAALCERDKVCAICKCADKPLVIDHDHVTGKVRGRLCVKHNTGLGRFGDSIEGLTAAINYLKERNEK